MVSLVARQGRELQRYTEEGHRLVVGCIPYRLESDKSGEDAVAVDHALQVLVISAQKGQEMMFPRGGWESDESIRDAASREAMEEAGVRGNVDQEELGTWTYQGKSHESQKVGTMFSLQVTEELLHWPEMGNRNRRWVTVVEARETCQQLWMREALARLVDRLSSDPRVRCASRRVRIGEQPQRVLRMLKRRRAALTEDLPSPMLGKSEPKSLRPTASIPEWWDSAVDHIKNGELPGDHDGDLLCWYTQDFPSNLPRLSVRTHEAICA